MLVNDTLIIEVKSVQSIAPIHSAQIITYLKLAERRVGLILHFNVVHLRDGGIKRVVHD